MPGGFRGFAQDFIRFHHGFRPDGRLETPLALCQAPIGDSIPPADQAPTRVVERNLRSGGDLPEDGHRYLEIKIGQIRLPAPAGI